MGCCVLKTRPQKSLQLDQTLWHDMSWLHSTLFLQTSRIRASRPQASTDVNKFAAEPDLIPEAELLSPIIPCLRIDADFEAHLLQPLVLQHILVTDLQRFVVDNTEQYVLQSRHALSKSSQMNLVGMAPGAKAPLVSSALSAVWRPPFPEGRHPDLVCC